MSTLSQSKQVVLEFETDSQAQAFYQWFRQQGGLETFMEADVSAELPDTLVKCHKPVAKDQPYYFRFQ